MTDKPMADLSEALEQSRPAIEAALADAVRELTELTHRQHELETLIARANAALGHAAPAAAPTDRLTLHDAIALVLREHDNRWMTVKELADEINDRNLYRKRDGTPVEQSQIHARTKNYEALFEKQGPQIRLRR